MANNILIVFAKAPEPGKVKTRLESVLGSEGASLLAENLLFFTLDKFSEFLPVLYGDRPHDFFKECSGKSGIPLFYQSGNDLGERMKNAIGDHIGGGNKIVLIGTDCPGLTAGMIQWAFAKLENFPMVIAPAQDGGYVLIGMKDSILPVFEGIRWGSGTVFTETMNRLNQDQCFIMETMPDLDRPEDIPDFVKKFPDLFRFFRILMILFLF